MFKFIFTLSFVFISSGFAQDIVTTTINGNTYTCTKNGSGSNPGGDAAACAEQAYRGPFSREQSTALCTGANSTAPAECGILAYRGPFSLDQAVQLCTNALTTGPTLCAIQVYRGPFSLAQAIQLCAFPSASVNTATCAINAYRGPYSVEQAIQLCHPTRPGLLSVTKNPLSKQLSTNIATQVRKSELNEWIKAANIKAVHEGVYKN